MTFLYNKDWSDKSWLITSRNAREVVLADWLAGIAVAIGLLLLCGVLG